MNILDTIVEHKRVEVAEKMSLYPEKLLQKSIYFDSPCVSMKKYINDPDKSGIIAEIKRKSPSKGDIHPYVSIEKTSIGYMQAGASGLSILTDNHFFGGKNEDLTEARELNFCPILRKDFIINEYQIIEARSIGADVILLIAAVLSSEEVSRLGAFAQSLGMEVLLEVHDQDELDRSLNDNVDLVGVNSRNLKDFTVSLDTAVNLSVSIPDNFVKVAESGIHHPTDIMKLEAAGYKGFLIGERFMKHSVPHKACAQFVDELYRLKQETEGSHQRAEA